MILTHSFTYCLTLLSRYSLFTCKTPLSHYLYHSLVNPPIGFFCLDLCVCVCVCVCVYIYFFFLRESLTLIKRTK